MFDGNLTWILAAVVGLFCVLPVVLFAVTVRLVQRYMQRLSDPNVQHLHRRYAQLKVEQPTAEHDELVRAVIAQQAVKAGVLGALTGLGGFVTLPVLLPVDMLIALRIQAATVQFVAETYGHATPGAVEMEIRRHLILSGGGAVTRRSSRLLMGFFLRFMGRSLAKFIPLLGALVGFAVNYAIAQAGGLVAQRWYSGELQVPGLEQGSGRGGA